MASNLEFGKSGDEQLKARYKMAFDSSVSIFFSDQVTTYIPEDGVAELTLQVVSAEDDTLARLGVGRVEATYVGSAVYEDGSRDSEAVNITTYTSANEELDSFTLMYSETSGEYSMDKEMDESSPLVDSDSSGAGQPAGDMDILTYLSIVGGIKESLAGPGGSLYS